MIGKNVVLWLVLYLYLIRIVISDGDFYFTRNLTDPHRSFYKKYLLFWIKLKSVKRNYRVSGGFIFLCLSDKQRLFRYLSKLKDTPASLQN